MPKFSVLVRSLALSDDMAEALAGYTKDPAEDKKAKPGMLYKCGNWHYLTYLKVVKVNNFDLPLWNMLATEVNTIRCVCFRLDANRLYVQGSAAEVKEICGLLDALTLQLHGASGKPADSLQYADYYRLCEAPIELDFALTYLEGKGLVAGVKQVTVKDMQLKLGSARSCVIRTDDYGGVKKLLTEANHKCHALTVSLRHPEKTSVELHADGRVKVSSQAAATDFDFEDLALRLGKELTSAQTVSSKELKPLKTKKKAAA